MNGENDQITNLLILLLIVFGVIFIILVVVYITLLIKKNSKRKDNKNGMEMSNLKTSNDKSEKGVPKYQSIEKFMEFDKIEDGMIIQKEKFKYIMVVECQGINYDLMSGIEKNAVEESFIQFLNTLRHPIQLYVQTRTVDLGNSISVYKQRVAQIEADLNLKKQQYEELKQRPDVPREQKQKLLFEVTKQMNLYEYAVDVIADTEKMSKNKNILNKKYYVVIPYYPSDLGSNDFDEYEIRNLAFSELYTRAQATIRTLGACGVNGKILNTKELIELLYVAYNRDQAEDFGLNKAIMAQYNKLYSTSEDLYEKKMREMDKVIEEKAVEKAIEKVESIKSRKEQEALEKERKMDALIDEMAKLIIQGNKGYIGDDIAKEAIEELNTTNDNVKEEVDGDVKKQKAGTGSKNARRSTE